MTVLIQPDTITVERPTRTVDEHGWAEDGVVTVVDTIKGTIQLTTPIDDPTASGTGSGPSQPYHRRIGEAFLSVRVTPGDLLSVTNSENETFQWRVQTCRLVEDPRSGGHLNCWVANISEVPTNV